MNPTLRSPPAPDSALDLLKLLALAAMLADHVGKAWHPLAAWPWHLAGRPAWLLFGLVMAYRLAAVPQRAARYLPRLLLWGALAQPAFAALGNERLNILFTLAAGALVHERLQTAVTLRGAATGWALLWPLSLAGLAAPWVDYGLAGVLLVPATVLLLQHAPRWALPCAAAMCLLGQGPVPLAMAVQVGLVLATTSLVAASVLQHAPSCARLPGLFFYAAYAGQLWVLAWALHSPPADEVALLNTPAFAPAAPPRSPTQAP